MRRRSTTRGEQGDYLVVCDRSGMTFWRSECVKEWNGLLVYKGFSEPRHSQDFLRARREDFHLPDARPARAVENESFSGPRITEMAVSAPAGSLGIAVESITGFNDGDRLRIYLDDGNVFLTQIRYAPIRIDDTDIPIDIVSILIDSPATIEITTPLPVSSAIGNKVVDITNQF